MIKTIFTTPIYEEQLCSSDPNLNNAIYQKVKDIKQQSNSGQHWLCDTFNTSNFGNLLGEEILIPIKKHTAESVYNFAVAHGLDEQKTWHINCNNIWINLSEPGNYQEFHYHNGNHFSAVYYAKVPKDSGDLIFMNPSYHSDMFPLPIDGGTDLYKTIHRFTPYESGLIIFRSNIMHMVEKNNSNEDRVSVAMNFSLMEVK